LITPFGVGPGCFRQPDFELLCNKSSSSSSSSHDPKLFLHDGTTEVTQDIDVTGLGGFGDLPIFVYVGIGFSSIIHMRASVHIYNFSFQLPGRSFSFRCVSLNISGCDLDIYSLDNSIDQPGKWICTTTCPSQEITAQMMTGSKNCDWPGCCSYTNLKYTTPQTIQLRIVRNHTKGELGEKRGYFWNTINISSEAGIEWSIKDQPRCIITRKNRTDDDYACASSHSKCVDSLSSLGYLCQCASGYMGNPYVLDGCLRDEGKSTHPVSTVINIFKFTEPYYLTV
jgi:hypothetical protein